MLHVLAGLCQQLDCTRTDDPDEESNCNDVSIFESILGQGSPEPEVESEEDGTPSYSNEHTNHVYVTRKSCSIPSPDLFQGVCIDSAAQKSVIGAAQAKAYCSLFDIPFQPSDRKARNLFSFGTHIHPGLEILDIRVPVSSIHFLSLSVGVVDTNVPFLLGLDYMGRYRMAIDTDKCVLSSRLQGWTVPLKKKLGHLCYERGPQILFPETALMKVHKHYHRPDSERLYAVKKRSDPEKTSPQVLNDLKRISSECDFRQRLSHAPHRFRLFLPDGKVVFNKPVCLDLMHLDNAAVLHVVDKDTKFSADSFLPKETSDDTWNTFMRIWVCLYIGFPDIMETDQGSQFMSNRWFNLSILRHESVPSRSVLGRQHNRRVLTQKGSGNIKINVCAKTEPPVEHAPHAPASLDFSFPNFPAPRTVFPTLSRRPLLAHSLEHPLLATHTRSLQY